MHDQFSSDTGSLSLSKIFNEGNVASIQLVVDALPQIIWIASPEGNVEYCNQAWLRLTGHALEQSLGRGWESALHPDDLEKCRSHWRKALQTGNPFETECRFRSGADGMYRWYQSHIRALKDDSGAIVKWIGSSADINEQKLTQDVLREAVEDVERQVKERTAELLTTNMQLLDAISERRQAAAMQEQDTQRLRDIIATQALLVQAGLNLPSFLDLAAQKIHRLTGASGTVVELVEGDEVVSSAATGVTVPFIGFRMGMDTCLSGLCIRKQQVLKCDNASDDPRVNLEACLKVGAVSFVVAPLYNKGVPIGVLKILSDVPNAFGQRDIQTLELMAGLLGAAIAQQVHMQSNERLLAERTDALTALRTEIENRLRSEQQLREIEQRTRLLLENSHDAFFSLNGEGIVSGWNAQAETLFGWPRQEAVGKRFSVLVLPEDERAGFYAELDRVIHSAEKTTINKRVRMAAMHRLGRCIFVELLFSAIGDGHEQTVNVFVRNAEGYKHPDSGLD